MKSYRISAAWVCLILLWASTGWAQDMRLSRQHVEQKKKTLQEKARVEKETAMAEARALKEEIVNDRTRLKTAIEQLTSDITGLRAENKKIEAHIAQLKADEEKLRSDLEQTDAVNREFRGVVQANAKDLKAHFIQSLQSGLNPGRHTFLEPIITGQRFPTMDDVDLMSKALFNEITSSGQVVVKKGAMIDRKGKERNAQLLIIGPFTGIYRLDGETGFLLYSEASQRYFALSRLPSARIRDTINTYLSGRRDDVYMDVSKGGAIRQLAHQLSLAEQVPKGGAIVWPILAILGAAVLILIERFFFFVRIRVNADRLIDNLREKIRVNDWDGCRALLESKKKKMIPKILLTAVALKDRTRPEIENALQEAILGEIPAIERFLSTLGMLAAIAPLLGLLGTVTGMINTFHVITYYGTGDPRMMSSGISEALVTTMLGLSVAIPIMLAHTFLSRHVEKKISRIEEKSVAFVNMVFKTFAETS
jgi:biopolymer transport protein ExbB